MRAMAAVLAFGLVAAAPATVAAQGRWAIDFENGAAISGYNDARIPGDSGTLFSFTEDLQSDTEYLWRVRGEVRLTPRQSLSVLAAPLSIDSSGTFDRPIDFAGATFAPGVPVTGLYVFNSYRLTWRYDLVDGERWRFGLGITGKIRDAETRLDSQGFRLEDQRGLRAAGELPAAAPVLQRRRAGTLGRRAGRAAGARRGRLRRRVRSPPAATCPSRRATGCSRAARTTTRSIRSRRCTTWRSARCCGSDNRPRFQT